jgi:hypothetical protein
MSNLVSQAADAAQAVNDATRGGAFDKAVRHFVETLRRAPDQTPKGLPADTVEVLSRLGDQVVEAIETRLYMAGDRVSVQRDLAAAVYDVRKAVEEIHRWWRHFAGTPP